MLSRRLMGLLIMVHLAGAAVAAEFKVLAPNAAREAVSEAAAVFEKATGHTVVIAWTGTEAITRRVADGEIVDVVVNSASSIERQSSEGRLRSGTRTDFARSGIGVAVPATTPKPDVTTAESLKAALLSARTVVVSSGTSGRHMVEVFARLGIADQVASKTRQPPSGAQIADFIAAGEADIGFQQISELLHAKGIRFLGPVPAALQSYTVYSAAIHSGSGKVDGGRAFLEALRAPATQAAVRASGMEPI